ncbi:MAG: tRNA (adenosine(37)-N6)-dimethylallyltransferase MiaA [Sphingobacteriales bacterium]|nr:tRNA (adenosine(37)-N6)-dimethylallyltransferase MiaA [Sphingobacteriales bacterium]
MSSPPKKTVIIICGPTAVGKTSVAIQLAQHYKSEIISADSRQCFKELNIGVARPSEKELEEIKHHFIASHSIQEEVTAASFEQYALGKTKELFAKHDVVMMVGGTGLYIKAFCEGLDKIPEVSDGIRTQIAENYKLKGLEWLQDEIEKKDPAFFATGEIQNPQRMMRALEVLEATGQSILSFRKGAKAKRDFNTIKIGLELPKEELHRNINARVDKMMEAGLLNEVKQLLPFKNLNALQTVGYAELFECMVPEMRLTQNSNSVFLFQHGVASIEEAVKQIKIHTRQYAKRQMTWFRKDEAIKWFRLGQMTEMIELVKSNVF